MLFPLIKNLFRPCLNWNLTYCLELLYLPTQGFILSPGQIQSHVVKSLWHLPAHLHLGRKYFCPFSPFLCMQSVYRAKATPRAHFSNLLSEQIDFQATKCWDGCRERSPISWFLVIVCKKKCDKAFTRTLNDITRHEELGTMVWGPL